MKSNIDKTTIQELLNQKKKDDIQKIVVGAIIELDSKFLLLERAPCDFMGGLITLPSGSVQAGENLLQALVREVKEETSLTVTVIESYLGFFDYESSSGKKVRQFNFLVETEPGDIRLDPAEHCNYYLLIPSDEEFSKLNISKGTKKVLLTAKTK